MSKAVVGRAIDVCRSSSERASKVVPAGLDRGRCSPVVRPRRHDGKRTSSSATVRPGRHRRERVLIKIASTLGGIPRPPRSSRRKASAATSRSLRHVHQAMACAEAGVSSSRRSSAASSIGTRRHRLHELRSGRGSGRRLGHPDHNYYKHFGHKTEVMAGSVSATSMRSSILPAATFTIAPNLLDQLRNGQGTLVRKLDP